MVRSPSPFPSAGSHDTNHPSVGADDWKCPRCLVDDDVKAGFASGLCTPCRARWLQQLGHVEYSDAFERRLYVISGIAGIVLGLGVWGCNIQLDWWEQGAALGLVCSSYYTYPRSHTDLHLGLGNSDCTYTCPHYINPHVDYRLHTSRYSISDCGPSFYPCLLRRPVNSLVPVAL